jgi:class 3 adenylate cyclase
MTGLHTKRRRAPDPVDPQYQLIVVIDTAGSSRWDDRTQLRARTLLDQVVQAAFRAAGIAWHKILTEDRGDGMILLIPATVPKTHLLDSVIPHLSVALHECNLRTGHGPRIRIRVAVHAGEVLRGPLGWVGTDLNLTCRLVNSRPLYRTFAHHPDADLVLITSEPIYQAVVRHGHRSIDPNQYTPVHVAVKEVRAKAWVHIPETGKPSRKETGEPALSVAQRNY